MSKRHQSSRRRNYGRRQHELRERGERTLEASFEQSGDDAIDRRRSTGALGRFDLGLGPGLVLLGLD